MRTGECTATEQCTHHNVYCTAPDCAYGRARRKQKQDAAHRVTDAERKVVEAAESFAVDPWRGDLEGTVIGVSMEYDANGQYVLYEDVLPILAAVRALHAARQGEQHGK